MLSLLRALPSMLHDSPDPALTSAKPLYIVKHTNTNIHTHTATYIHTQVDFAAIVGGICLLLGFCEPAGRCATACVLVCVHMCKCVLGKLCYCAHTHTHTHFTKAYARTHLGGPRRRTLLQHAYYGYPPSTCSRARRSAWCKCWCTSWARWRT
jgi:hypothetical protein